MEVVPLWSAIKRIAAVDIDGNERYAHNLIAIAPTSNIAIILIYASDGISGQIQRDSRIIALLRILNVVLAVNKMDLASFSREGFFRGRRTAAVDAAAGRRLSLASTACP